MRRIFICCFLILSLAACTHAGSISTPSTSIKTVQVDDVDLGYTITGHGEPLLMIMGYAGTMDVWAPVLVEKLANSFMVIRFDNRNMGYSSTSPNIVTIDTMTRDALGLLDALSIPKAHVMGWSMGSIIAQEMALARPAAVNKLILYGTASKPEKVMEAVKRMAGLTPEQFMTQLFPKEWIALHPDIFSRLPAPAIPPTPEAIDRQAKAIAAWPGTNQRLHAITHDTLVMAGEEDTVTPPALNLAVAAYIPGASLVRFKGGSHWLMYQAPEDMASAIKAFISTDHNLLH